MELKYLKKEKYINKYLYKLNNYQILSKIDKIIIDEILKDIIVNIITSSNENMNKIELEFILKYIIETYKEKYVLENNEKIICKIEDLPLEINANFKTYFFNEFPINYIYISKNLIKNLILGDISDFQMILNVLYHELTHYNQTIKIKNVTLNDIEKNTIKEVKKYYQLALEQTFRIIEKSYYKENYYFSFSENDAKIQSSLLTNKLMVKFLEKHHISDYSLIKERKKYNNNFYNSNLNIKEESYESGYKILNTLAIKIIKKESKFIEEFPILELSFFKDGKMKKITDILEDREILLNKLGKEYLKEINDLFLLVFNSIEKNFNENEIMGELLEYLIRKSHKDKFVLGILNEKISNYDEEEKVREMIFGVLKKYDKASNFNQKNKSKIR